jgi:hypothetical protein
VFQNLRFHYFVGLHLIAVSWRQEVEAIIVNLLPCLGFETFDEEALHANSINNNSGNTHMVS